MTQTINNPADTGTRLSAEDGESTTNLARWPLDRSATIGVPLPPREFILLTAPTGPDALDERVAAPDETAVRLLLDPDMAAPDLYVGRHRHKDDEPERRGVIRRILARLGEGGDR